MPTPNETIDTFTVNGRDYEVFRVGLSPNHSSWNVFGIRPLHTAAEKAMLVPARPYPPYAYASPVAPSRGHVGHPEAPITEGWQVRDELNRTVFGYATTFADMAGIADASLGLPPVHHTTAA